MSIKRRFHLIIYYSHPSITFLSLVAWENRTMKNENDFQICHAKKVTKTDYNLSIISNNIDLLIKVNLMFGK